MSALQKLLKITVVGEGGVGKTTLIKRYITGVFSHSKTTIGVSFAIANVNIQNTVVKMQIWDLAGEERFRNLLPSFCKGSNGALVVFDLSRYPTFLALAEWIELVRKNTCSIPIILAGSKADLTADKTVDQHQIKELIDKYCLKNYYSFSSKTGENIDKIFLELASSVLQA